MANIIYSIFFEVLLFSFSFEECFEKCETCFENSTDKNDMKCSSCKDSQEKILYNTSNCVPIYYYPNYYVNKSDGILYPCSLFTGEHCYKCDPYYREESFYLNYYHPELKEKYGVCVSCIQGYENNKFYKCDKCNLNITFPVIIHDIYGDSNDNCENHRTYCSPLINNEIICPDNAPFFNNISHSCHNFEIQYDIYKDDICLVKKKQYRDIPLFINSFEYNKTNYPFPGYNFDKSGCLLIELSLGEYTYNIYSDTFRSVKHNKRKFYFYNEEGRGIFDEINDKYENVIESNKNVVRYFSTSLFLKSNNSDEYRYYLNFESQDFNLELLDLKTGELTTDYIYEVFPFDEKPYSGEDSIQTQLFELNEKNNYLLAFKVKFYRKMLGREYTEYTFFIFIFHLDEVPGKKINVYSLKVTKQFEIFKKIVSGYHFIQTKKGYILFSCIIDEKIKVENGYDYNIEYLVIYDLQYKKEIKIDSGLIYHGESFQKLLNLKEEMVMICYIKVDSALNYGLEIKIFNYEDNGELKNISSSFLNTDNSVDMFYFAADMLLFSETKAIYIIQKVYGRILYIYVFNFFDNYKTYIITYFKINLFELFDLDEQRYSFIFKYKDLLGIQTITQKTGYGFILFGYFNSTDPKQILDIKKDGLNYIINLGSYLTLQSNIFEYEIKGIKIIEVPSLYESGLYLISNNTKHIIKKDDFIELNTAISLRFSYNGILKTGNYLFKFVGVLEEPTFDKVEYYSDETYLDIGKGLRIIKIDKKYKEIYNERRNMNITGRVALVQINVLNDTKVFCDKKYDESSIKTKEGQYLTCGESKFYDIENANEITQTFPGINYYFDKNKNVFIKCHERCKTCSREYNTTNMNCDECFENFFLSNNNCLQISKCEYNYYYDYNLDLKCIPRSIYCPNFKPYENKISKECIKDCNIDEFNYICNPTNNLISINETREKILKNEKYLNLKEKLLKNKEKYVIEGNNVSFIFSTSEIEKEELYNNHNSTTILLNNCENILKLRYSIPEELPLPILKIEVFNNYSDYFELYYELFNPQNFTQKLDLSFCSSNYIEMRFPLALKQYKMDLILKTKELGYNIFDLNDSFYNDICSVFTYNNSDLSLSERKSLIDLSDEKLCINNCSYSNYDINSLRSICICKIGYDYNNNSAPLDTVINNNTKIENNNFLNALEKNIKNIDISKSWNIKVVKCFSIIFRKNLFTDNFGFYITLFIFIFHILLFIFHPLSKIEIIYNTYCSNIISQMKKICNYKISDDTIKTTRVCNNILNNTDILNVAQNENKAPKNIKINILSKRKKKRKKKLDLINLVVNDSKLLDSTKSDKAIKFFPKSIINDLNIDEKNIKEKSKKNLDNFIDNIIKFIDVKERIKYLSEPEIEDLPYKQAFNIDKRIMSNIYFSMLKEKNKLISIFLNDKDYNIESVKISLFLFNFNLSLTVNALFFNDEAIYEINQNESSNNLSTQIARIFLSFIISTFLGYIVESLSLTHKNIIKLRYFNSIRRIENEVPTLIKKLKIKYVLYNIITIFFNFIFWYYITAFCAIYSIIQINMIKDSLMSFLLNISYSIIFCMITTFIRHFSLKKENKLNKFLYFISWIVSLI